jgi:hypothetical protein
MTDERDKFLAIYLNDHLGGAAAGLALARRIARNHQRTTIREQTASIAAQIGEDRDALLAIMRDLNVPVKRVRSGAAVLVERLARLKLNGHLVTRSPLSNLIELESMRLGVEGKLACWRSLLTMADTRLNGARLEQLCQRAESQIATLEQLRLRALTDVLVR